MRHKCEGHLLKIMSATCVRNEAPFLLEWIAYYRLLGVTDFVFFSNDCEDGTDHILDGLAAHGVVQHIRHQAEPGKSIQWKALQTLWTARAAKGHDWFLFSDIDEFPVIHTGGHRLADAIAAMSDGVEAIALPWRLFGANGVANFHDVPVTAQFTRSAPPDLFHPIAGRFFKTLFRPASFQKVGVHRPKRRNTATPPVWADGSGQILPESFAAANERLILPGRTVGRAIIEMNHYSLKSAESFLVKTARGLANRQVKSIDLHYWIERNFNSVENTAIHIWSDALQAEMAALKALPGIAALHDAACDWHRAKFSALVKTSAGYRLFSDCLHAAQSIPLPEAVALRLYGMFQQITPDGGDPG